MATLRLASWAKSLEYADLPDEVVRAAVRSFYNWVGCAIGGSTHPATAIAVRSLLLGLGPCLSTALALHSLHAFMRLLLTQPV